MSDQTKQLIRITDVASSIRICQNKQQPAKMYMGWIIDKDVEYVWVGRHHTHTAEEIEEGKRQNPEVRTMPIDEFSALLGTVTPEKNKGETVVLWPSKNGLHFFCTICIPAYTQTDGVEGEFVSVEIDA